MSYHSTVQDVYRKAAETPDASLDDASRRQGGAMSVVDWDADEIWELKDCFRHVDTIFERVFGAT